MTTDIATGAAVSAKGLSERARAAWAKSDVDRTTGELISWLPLHKHLKDTAAIAAHVWDDWLPPSVRTAVTEAVGNDQDARDLAIWLAGAHDIGKLSPAFAIQSIELARPMVRAGLPISDSIAGTPERRVARHEIVSHLTVSQWLIERQGFDRALADKLGSVLAAHHGRPPGPLAIAQTRQNPLLHGAGVWADTRIELLEHLTTLWGIDPAHWRSSSLSQPVLVLLSAFVIVADWIASSDHFPLADPGTQPLESGTTRAARAWRELDMPSPWTAHPPVNDHELFRSRFDIDAEPRPIQAEMMRLARAVPAPCLMILESEMGSGKTEAALAAAEILAARFARSGVAISLPTQATADSMYTRAVTWAQHLDLAEPLNVFLAHGKASLNQDHALRQRQAHFRGIGEDGHGSGGEEGDLIQSHLWMSDAKRGPLSDLVIGTIDQVLFGALRTRHLALRHLAFAGKVVILDEVHAADAHMNVYLERVLHWLGAYGVPVIMLSATLPSVRRQDLAAAYESGRPPKSVPRRSRAARRQERETGEAGETTTDAASILHGDIGYPAITVAVPSQPPQVSLPATSGTTRTIAVERLGDEPAELRDLLEDALADGGCAVVIRNTVKRAQETAADLRAHFGDSLPVTLAHSRFLGLDRAANDRRLIDQFGANGHRPSRHIVVATQVVEQSLDIDFDLMVTDLAPIDLLLQRAGRLHRHPRDNRPPRLSSPRLVITGVDWGANPPQTYRGNTTIYDPHILLRTLALLEEGPSTLTLPSDIPKLIQRAYETASALPLWPAEMSKTAAESQRRMTSARSKAGTFRLDTVDSSPNANLLNWIKFDAGDPDRDDHAHGAVRDTEETLEVIVLQQDEEGVLRTPAWLDRDRGIPIPTEQLPPHWLTRVILGCTLRLPAALCRGPLIDRHIRTLEHRYPAPAWHGSHALRGELVLVVDAEGRAFLDPYDLVYTRENGLAFSSRVDAPESELPL